jgi:hypothetical protein
MLTRTIFASRGEEVRPIQEVVAPAIPLSARKGGGSWQVLSLYMWVHVVGQMSMPVLIYVAAYADENKCMCW